MCNPSCIEFGQRRLSKNLVKGLRVLEVGAYDVNGSLKEFVMSYEPASYLGVDVVPGPNVDYLCPVELIVECFSKEAFGLVICTEMLEHVKDWRLAVTNLKLVCRIGGTILLTTRSNGFPKHDFPGDYWRFETADMEHIFSDCTNVVIEPDLSMPGVFVRATRSSTILNLSNYGVSGV